MMQCYTCSVVLYMCCYMMYKPNRYLQVIACIAVNDAFVMEAWGEQNSAKGKVCVMLLCPISSIHPDTLPQ